MIDDGAVSDDQKDFPLIFIDLEKVYDKVF